MVSLLTEMKLKDLFNFVNDLQDKVWDEIDRLHSPTEIQSKINKLVIDYNEKNEYKFSVEVDNDYFIDITPLDKETFNALEQLTENRYSLSGFVWADDMNKMIFAPKYMNDKEKIAFLCNIISNLDPSMKSYCKKYWKEYIEYESKIGIR